MTNINIYCLFDGANELFGVYSSIKAVHRDAIKLCNKGISAVYIKSPDGIQKPSITLLRNIFKGAIDVKTQYVSDICSVTILKTGLKE
jgi:hypothetical protein|tara:strand:+ start:1432 stop:1695 length:264 start_codon:yes stop_codon:yes gene_type:complete